MTTVTTLPSVAVRHSMPEQGSSASRVPGPRADSASLSVTLTVVALTDVQRVLGVLSQRGYHLAAASVHETEGGEYAMRCVVDASRGDLLRARLNRVVSVRDVILEPLG